MEAYARNDTHFLITLAGILEKRLRELGRWEWFEQSCAKAVATARIDKERDIEAAWRITGSSDLQGRASAILRALWLWRDARGAGRGPARLSRPSKRKAHRGGRAVGSRRGGQLLPLLTLPPAPFRRRREAALAVPSEEWPRPIRKPRIRPTPEQERFFMKLKTRRDATAKDLQLDPALIAPKATLEQIAADPATAAARLMPWQLALLQPISEPV